MMKNLIIYVLGILFVGLAVADVETISVQKKFNRVKRENPLMVVFAYQLPVDSYSLEDVEKEGGVHSARWHAVYNVYRIFEAFSDRPSYDAVLFALVNYLRGDMKMFQQEWGLEHDALLFFKDGQLLVTQIIDAASFSPEDMRRFLERANILDFARYESEERELKKRRERERRRLESRPVVSFGVGLGYGCAYPWCSGCVSPWSWGYGGWGCWGRRCCW